jgi:predicted O-methyltransferase YrrM
MDDYHRLIANKVTEHSNKLGRLIDYIEVGTHRGDSAMAVLGTGKVRFAVLIDNFSNTHCGQSVASLKETKNRLKPYEGIFEIMVGDSRNVLPSINEEFDIGFVDGDHTNGECQNDMVNMWSRIREEGIMFVDDIRNPFYTLEDVVDRFAFEKKLAVKYHDVHYGLDELTRT